MTRAAEQDTTGDRTRSGTAAAVSRRTFVKALGAGLLITVTSDIARAAGGRQREGALATRLHIAEDGAITLMTGKIEMGQGARAEISQAAAEELRVPFERVRLIMGDTELCPDDGITAGSRTTPSTIPTVRRACATAREVLVDLAAKKLGVDRAGLAVKDGAIAHAATNRTVTYGDLAKAGEVVKAFADAAPGNVALTPVKEWKVMGSSAPRPNLRDLATGAHLFPSDITRPGMLRGKVLRPPSYGARLVAIDLTKAQALDGVTVVRDGDFVGCAAPTRFRAEQALELLAESARWEPAPHVSSSELFAHLRERAQGRRGRSDGRREAEVAEALARAHTKLDAEFHVAYVQHAPMETRAAVAEWTDGKLTVWTGSQAPFGVRSEVARAFGLPAERVRIIIPDMGCGYGGKHTGEASIEAARLARAAGRPVALQWTRREEFTWAYFRPAALIDIRAGLDDKGRLAAWDFTNINSGAAAIATPYDIPAARTEYVPCDAPLRQGSYRTLAATANNFARECFMDELAAAASADPLAFRLGCLSNGRIRDVLELAATRFGWGVRAKNKQPGVGVGLACGTEKGSVVAACAEIEVDRAAGAIKVRRVTEVFECGAIQNPANLLSQVQSCIVMGMGAALTEEIRFENGRMLTASFADYRVPRFKDVPPLDIVLHNRPDLDSVGGGETPIIAIAPAIANAVFDATGVRVRAMPIRPPA